MSRPPRRQTANQALRILLNIHSDESGNDDSDREECVLPANAVAPIDSFTSSDDDASSQSSENISIPPPLAERVKNKDRVANHPITGNYDIVLGKDGTTKWRVFGQCAGSAGRKKIQNVRRVNGGLTSYAIHRVDNSPYSSFKLFFSQPMLRHVQKCTEAEAHRQGRTDWCVPLNELEIVIGLC